MNSQHGLKYPLPLHIHFLETYLNLLIEYDMETSIDEAIKFTLFEYYQHLYHLENIIFATGKKLQQDYIRAAHMYLKENTP